MMNFIKTNYIASAVNANLNHLVAGDFNGDGNQDFLAVRINYSDIGKTSVQSEVYLGNGTGQFTLATDLFVGGNPSTNFASRVYARDINGDGVDDILFTDHGMDTAPFPGSTLKLYLSGNGKLINSSSLLNDTVSFYHQASFGDVNNDGKLDILVEALSGTASGETLFTSNASGSFSENHSQQFITGSSEWETHTSSAIVDVNGDHKADLILGNWDGFSAPAKVMFGDGSGNFSNSNSADLPSSPVENQVVVDIRPIDLNGDGFADLVLSITDNTYTISYLQLLTNNGDGTFRDETQLRFSQTATHSTNQNWHHRIEVVDFNHDGFADLYVGGPGGDEEAVLINDGNGKFSKEVVSTNQWQTGTVADVNNDGMTDIILTTTENMDLGFDIYINSMVNSHIYKSNFGGDTLLGSSTTDVFISGDGNDRFTGNGGLDIAQMHGNRSNYDITTFQGTITVRDSTLIDGIDTMIGISRIQFTDKTIAFDLDGNAGQVYRLYQAAFDRVPDHAGLGDWIEGMDRGMGLSQVATGFINSAEFKALYGNNPSNSEFVTLLYDNVLHRAPDTTGYNDWMNGLSSGMSREQALIGFSESTENKVALMAFDMDGNMGKDYRLYQAAFDRKPDVSGLDYWYHQMNSGVTLEQVASGFINSAEFKALYGNNPTNAEFVTLLYDNVLHRAPDTAGYNDWMNGLDHGITREQVLIGFSESLENQLSLVGLVQTGIEFV